MSALRSLHPVHRSRHRPAALVALLVLLSALAAPGTWTDPVYASASPWQVNEQSRVRLVSPWEIAPRAAELRLGLEFELAPGWHVYWRNSGDAGFPPAIQVLNEPSSPGILGLDLLWPAPERYELRGGLVAFGYEEHVVYPLRLAVDQSLDTEDPSDDRLVLTTTLDYLVCEVDCIPYSYELTLEQPLAGAGKSPVTSKHAEILERWWERLPISLDRTPPELPGVTTQGRLDLVDPAAPRLLVEMQGVTAASGSPEIFLEAHDIFDTGPPKWRPTPDGVRFTVPLSFREVPDELPSEADFAWTVTRIRPAGSGAEERDAPIAVEARRTLSAASTGASTAFPTARTEPASGPPARSPAPASSWPRALLAGLLLALTPSLLALFGLRLLALGRLTAPGIRRGATGEFIGLLFGFELVAFAFSGLPVWGAQLQSPRLVAGLAVATLGLALAAWRLLPTGSEPRETDPGRSLIPGFVSGLLAAFLALAWNVPGLTFEPLTVLAAALGASVPYLLVLGSPRLAAGFAKLGRRVRLREGLGFLAMLGLLWPLYLLTGSIAPEGLALVELTLLAVGLLAWTRTVVTRTWVRGLVTILLVAAAAYVVVLVDESPRQLDQQTTPLVD